MLRWWQRKQGPPSRAATPIAQKSRRLCRWSTTAAPAVAGGRERARAEAAGSMLCTWTTSASSSRAAAAHVVLVAAAAQQRERRACGRDSVGRAALEDGVRDARAAQGGGLQLDGALLASLDAIAVVYHEDAHAAGLRYPADGRRR